jgi:hypothetical protein
VTSTLDGHTALPHRIHWIAKPSPQPDVTEVDFLVDGKQLWVEHSAPYFYGDDGSYLVTSFLKPGTHTFTVRAIGFGGETAKDSVTATVPKAPLPPEDLAGMWKRARSLGGAGNGLLINAEGWAMAPVRHLLKTNGGNRVDVAYLSPGLVEVRTGMATGHDTVAGASFDNDLNGFCNNEPGSPARYRWSVSGTHLSFTFVSGHPCPGFTKWLTAASWTRVS